MSANMMQVLPLKPLSYTLKKNDGFCNTSSKTFTEAFSNHSHFQDSSSRDHHSLLYEHSVLPHEHQSFIYDQQHPIASNCLSYFQQCHTMENSTCRSCSRFDTIQMQVFDKISEEEVEELEDKEVDDDEFFEEEYADAYREHMMPDSPTRLLHFVKMITSDIQNQFARNKGNEDYCNVYEERFKTMLSGRELYYADLIAIASNPESPSLAKQTSTTNNCFKKVLGQSSSLGDCADKSGAQSHCSVTCNQSGQLKPCSQPHKGLEMRGAGLGPLEELFLCNGSKVSLDNLQNRALLANCLEGDTLEQIRLLPSIPMTMRKLPNSFWNEPAVYETVSEKKYCNLTVSHTPDFTDLFYHWADKC